MNRETLDLNQKPEPGVFLIEASAGTGKTYSIANLFLHFILQGKKISEILVVTFTEAATKELRERVRSNLLKAFKVAIHKDKDEQLGSILNSYDANDSIKYLETAVLSFDQAAIFTIHGFCQRMLQENAFESMTLFDAELLENDLELKEEIVEDFIRRKTYGDSLSQTLNKSKLLSLARNYQGQKIVDQVENQAFESAKEKFREQWQKEGQAFKSYLNSIKELKHNKTCKTLKLHDLSPIEVGDLGSDSLELLKVLSIDELCQCKRLKFERQSFNISTSAAELLPFLSDVSVKVDFLNFFQEQFPRRKSELSVLTFDDLINKLYQTLEQEGEQGPLHDRIREQFKIALVDEFQDTDPVQYRIFSSLFGNKSHCKEHSFYMIGDPKQSIYAFRGADIFAYLEARKRADRMFTLDTNYRSEPQMVDAVNQFFLSKGKSEAFAFAPQNSRDGIEFDAALSPEELPGKRTLVIEQNSEPLQLCWLNKLTDDSVSKTAHLPKVPEVVTKEIVKLLNLSAEGKAYFLKDGRKEPILPLDIAILTVTHDQAFIVKDTLSKHGIPGVIKKSGNIFSSQESAAVMRFLEAVHNPREKSILPLLLSSFFSFTAEELKALDSSVHFEYLKEFVEYRKNWDQNGFLNVFQKFMDRHQVFERALAHGDGERVISNIYQLREILHEEEESKGLGLPGLIRFLNEKMTSSDREDEEYLQRLETDADAVQILTVHKSKGLEFPIVFCPYFFARSYKESGNGDITFHDEENQACISLNDAALERQKYINFSTREKAGELLRLLYVALTRAANRCYLYWGTVSRDTSIFSYLADESFQSEKFLEGAMPNQNQAIHIDHWQRVLGQASSICFSEIESGPVPKLIKNQQSSIQLKEPRSVKLSFSNWMNGSYSALTKHHTRVYFSEDMEFVRDDDDEIVFIEEEDEEATGFFAFPKGANPGTALHEMFEHIDFQNPDEWSEVINEKLLKYRLHTDGINPDEEVMQNRVLVCLDMIKNVLSTKLDDGFSLSEISLSQRLDEMDFYFPVKDINLYRLVDIFRKHYKGDEREVFAEDLMTLNYRMEKGFLNGAIDLTFEKDGRFYIVDWKSNHLGNDYEDYTREAVRDKVREKLYFLQYHIYTVSLHLYLEKNLLNYSYKKHFGGVYYAFIRGMKPGVDYGIHYDRLPEGLVKDLSKLFLKGVKR